MSRKKRLEKLNSIITKIKLQLPDFEFVLKLPEDAVSQRFTQYCGDKKIPGYAINPEYKNIEQWVEDFIKTHKK
jgi:hypothetical protein